MSGEIAPLLSGKTVCLDAENEPFTSTNAPL
jgi:hypothetical protein